jgi:hypothetical protein
MTKRLLVSLPLLLSAAFAIYAAEPRVSRSAIAVAEKTFDGRVIALWNDQLALLGPTRGVYIDGFGVVLSTEVQLAQPPTSLMNPTPTKQQLVDMHKRKLERLPQLKDSIRTALIEAAAKFTGLPATEEIVFGVIISRFPGEDTAGIPLQIVMRASKQRLLEARNAAGSGADQIEVAEY